MIEQSVVIPVFNNKKCLFTCLKEINKQIDSRTEIIIVNDGSSQRGMGRVARKFSARYLKLQRNGGAGRARNFGVKKAKGKFLIFIDSDVAVSPRFFKRLGKKLKNLPKQTCLQGVYSLRTPVENFCSQYKNLYYFYNFFYRIRGNNFSYLSSHCFMIPKKIFEQVGGFNSKIKTVIEDADLSYRLLKNGYRIILDRKLTVAHLKRFSFLNLVINDARLSFAKTKHILRNFFKDDKEKLIIVSGGKINEMYQVILSTLIASSMFLVFFMLFLSRNKMTFYLLIFLFFLFILLNFKFFEFIKIKKGWFFLSKIILLFYFDMLFAFLGILLGFFDYWFLKRKY